MSEENKGVETKEADLTANQTAPVDEKKEVENKEGQPENKPEEVTLSKEDFEKLQKKAQDFENSIVLKRLNKLKNETPEGENKDELIEKFTALEKKLESLQQTTFNSNLTNAYQEFIKDNPWANDDSKFEKIKENFNSVGTETKEELLSKFKSAAQTSFPSDYEKHLEEKIKAKVLSEKSPTQDGGSANSEMNLHKDTKPETEEDKIKAKMASLYQKAQPGR